MKVLRDGGAVSFRGARFAYRGAETATVDGVDLDIPAGKKMALVGPSGAGKTTIFNLLLRFYELYSGGIADRRAEHPRRDAGLVARRHRAW